MNASCTGTWPATRATRRRENLGYCVEALRPRGSRSKRAEEFLALCQTAGFDVTLSEQIVTELWIGLAEI